MFGLGLLELVVLIGFVTAFCYFAWRIVDILRHVRDILGKKSEAKNEKEVKKNEVS